jgi:hypothetical protein
MNREKKKATKRKRRRARRGANWLQTRTKSSALISRENNTARQQNTEQIDAVGAETAASAVEAGLRIHVRHHVQRRHGSNRPSPASPLRSSNRAQHHLGDDPPPPAAPAQTSRAYLASTSLEPEGHGVPHGAFFVHRGDMEFRTAPGHRVPRRFSHAELNAGRGIRAQAGAFQEPGVD